MLDLPNLTSKSHTLPILKTGQNTVGNLISLCVDNHIGDEMKVGRILALPLEASGVLYATGVMAAYLFSVSICYYPPHVVSDKELISNALEQAAYLASDYPEYHNIDKRNCCRAVKERLGGVYAVTFSSIASLKWANLVSVRYGLNGDKIAVFPMTQCGTVANG